MLVKLPSRSRPDLFCARVHDYLADPTVTMLVTLDNDDDAMNRPEIHRFLAEREERVTVRWGDCTSKIEAVNDGLAETEWSLCMVGSDDMVPQRPDYAQRIAELFYAAHPNGDGVLHLNDGRVGRRLNTLPILDRAYFDRFGYVYRAGVDGYRSTHADNEFQEVSESLRRAAYVDEVIVAHRWIGSTHPKDELHRYNESFYREDERTFRARKKAGFPR